MSGEFGDWSRFSTILAATGIFTMATNSSGFIRFRILGAPTLCRGCEVFPSTFFFGSCLRSAHFLWDIPGYPSRVALDSLVTTKLVQSGCGSGEKCRSWVLPRRISCGVYQAMKNPIGPTGYMSCRCMPVGIRRCAARVTTPPAANGAP